MTPVSRQPNKPGLLTLTIKDKSALYLAYMPFVKNGGLFIPTSSNYRLGDEVFMLLNLMGEDEKLPVAGRVIWMTPKGAQGKRTQGSACSSAIRTAATPSARSNRISLARSAETSQPIPCNDRPRRPASEVTARRARAVSAWFAIHAGDRQGRPRTPPGARSLPAFMHFV